MGIERLLGLQSAPRAQKLLSIAKQCITAVVLGASACAAVAAAERHCPPAQTLPTPQEMAVLQRQAQDRGLLWQLDYQGRTSWLYGTIHVNKRAWWHPGPRTVQALASADALALELDLHDPAVIQALSDGMRAQPGAAPLPAALQQRLDRQLQAACAQSEAALLRPQAQVLTLLTLVARRQGLDPQLGVDVVLASAAREMGKPVLGLETPETQLRELISDDPQQVRRSVNAGLQQLERPDAARHLARLAQAWADGDSQLLDRYPQWCGCLNSPAERAQYQRLIEGRNPGMAAAIAAQLRSGRTLFAAVGAMHLVGARSVPALLAAQGIHVRRVEFGAQDRAPVAGAKKPVAP